MSRYGTVTGPATAQVAFVQSATAADLAAKANATIAALALAAPARTITGITLAGAGDGHTFAVLIESAESAVVNGGIVLATNPPTIRCYEAAQHAALAAARLALQTPPTTDFTLDEQLAGGKQGTRFMGLIVSAEFDLAAGSAGGGGGVAALAFGSFFALMPGDNAATIAVGAPMLFPQNGPANGVLRNGVSPSQFLLPAIGTYEVFWQVSVSEPGQLMLDLDSGIGPVALPETVAGRATGTSQIINSVEVTTTAINSVLRLINPTGNAAALTITPIAGGTHSVSAWLVIKRLA